jgi:transmembrane sensor
MKKSQAQDLINKYQQGNATPEERMLVEQGFLKYLENNPDTPNPERIEAADKRIRKNLLKHINLPGNGSKTIFLWPRLIAAASVIILITIGGYFLMRKPVTPNQVADNIKNEKVNDIAPGGNKAVLTLANGKQIILTGAQNGKLATEGSTAISKTADGELTYDTRASGANTELAYNTMTTPRGGRYLVILGDGTKVLLNAASSLKYPAVFNGNARNVELTGEAYFEVAHNAAKPFHVTSNGQLVEVLGTHFNVNAYADEPAMKTTLIEGRVRISRDKQTALLKPGQQSVVDNAGKGRPIDVKNGVDTDQILAWKNGEFDFNDTDIQMVMRQISRWYDVDVEYVGKIPTDKLSGTFSRNVSASKALKLLQFTGVDFKIEGRKIIVK